MLLPWNDFGKSWTSNSPHRHEFGCVIGPTQNLLKVLFFLDIFKYNEYRNTVWKEEG